MTDMNDSRQVAEQYASDSQLNTRLKLHQKHSTSKVPVSDWFFAQYAIEKPCRILELGCGNASQWTENARKLPEGSLLVLSDLSQGMVDATWAKFKDCPNAIVQRIDIQDIPFANESFDIVIANHMLYHVPDLNRALQEVKRVLTDKGTFFASTNGSGGMHRYLHEKLSEFNPRVNAFQTEWNFTLQNGRQVLQPFFGGVRLVEYEDSLRITETQDLIDWIHSSIAITGIEESDLDGLFEFFEAIRLQDGAICIPKEMGMFISQKQ